MKFCLIIVSIFFVFLNYFLGFSADVQITGNSFLKIRVKSGNQDLNPNSEGDGRQSSGVSPENLGATSAPPPASPPPPSPPPPPTVCKKCNLTPKQEIVLTASITKLKRFLQKLEDLEKELSPEIKILYSKLKKILLRLLECLENCLADISTCIKCLESVEEELEKLIKEAEKDVDEDFTEALREILKFVQNAEQYRHYNLPQM